MVMRILVTGGNGFVGSLLVAALTQKGHSVTVFSGDIRNTADCEKNVKRAQVVYHLAAILDESKKREMEEVNVQGTSNVLEAAIQEGVQQFIHVSSVGVMGSCNGAANEECSLCPLTHYEKTKADGEMLVWNAQEAIPITIIRPAAIFSAQSEWKIIVDLVKAGFPIVGDGKNTFQIVNVHDLISALLFVLQNPDAMGERFIVAEETGKTLENIYSMIQKELEVEKPVKKIGVLQATILIWVHGIISRLKRKKPKLLPAYISRGTKNREYSIAKMKGIGWMPQHTTHQTIREMVNELR
jgi:UDP-glucose 4-epimerase